MIGRTALPAARVWHAVTAVVAAVALLLPIWLAVVDEGQLSLFERLLRLLGYFAVQGNLLALVSGAQLAYRPDLDGTAWRVARFGAVLGLGVTLPVFLLVIGPARELSGTEAVADVLLHYLAPLLLIGGWVLFGPRRRIGVRVALLTLAWPVGWYVWTLSYGAISGFYPYPFVDVGTHGFGGVLLRAVLVLGLLAGVAAAVWVLDGRLNATAPHGWTPPWERTGRDRATAS